MSATLFLALLLMGIGVGYVLKGVFQVKLPMTRYVLGITIVLVGVHLLLTRLDSAESTFKQKVWFSDSEFTYEVDGVRAKYSTVFGHSMVDLQHLKPTDSLRIVEIDVAFGHVDVYLPDSLPYRIRNSVAFGSTSGLENNENGFGESVTESYGLAPDGRFIEIEGNVAFGAIEYHKSR
ncbi:MAG: LiaF-related protein [Salinivirgaceae bacterium]